MISLVPTTIVTGFLGVGKTTALMALFRSKPVHEKWAVLVNEFGQTGIDGAELSGAGITVREVAGGCMCCAAKVSMEVTLNRLLREVKPDRLLIEPSGLGHPAGLIDILRGEYLSKAIDLRATICLIDPRQFADPQFRESPLFTNQLEVADILVINKTDLATPVEIEALRSHAQNLFPPKLVVAETQFGKLNTTWLDMEAGSEPRTILSEDGGAPMVSRGWTFLPTTCFDRTKLMAWLDGLKSDQGILRAKGVFHTEREWLLFNWTADGSHWQPTDYRRDSRVEFIASKDHQPDWNLFEQELNQCLIQY